MKGPVTSASGVNNYLFWFNDAIFAFMQICLFYQFYRHRSVVIRYCTQFRSCANTRYNLLHPAQVCGNTH